MINDNILVSLFLIMFHRYLALEGLCLMSNSEFSADAVRKHQETVVSALKVRSSVAQASYLLFSFSVYNRGQF